MERIDRRDLDLSSLQKVSEGEEGYIIEMEIWLINFLKQEI